MADDGPGVAEQCVPHLPGPEAEIYVFRAVRSHADVETAETLIDIPGHRNRAADHAGLLIKLAATRS